MKFIYMCALVAVVVLSFGFIDPNFPYQPFPEYFTYLHSQRLVSTTIYVATICVMFGFYLKVLVDVRRNRIKPSQVLQLILLSVVILFFSYPAAFTYDIFNYIATAKVTYLYHQNPYLVMPIEIPNEPMLAYMHAANKVALYGGFWIFLTAIPHVLGLGNIILTLATFKLFIVLFYFLLLKQLINLSDNKIWTLAFFGLNPLILLETVVSAHNDVVMMFFAVFSFALLRKKRYFLSIIFFVLSICIKYSTILLLPLILKKSMNWRYAAIFMYIAFLLSPLREELYAWYFIWVLPFVALIPESQLLVNFSLAFSFGLMFRIAPYLYTWRWDGITPIIKRIVSFVPPAFVALWYGFRKKN